MTKPDDIPQDVWDVAVGWATAEAQMTAGRPVVAHAVARAIMAEREACAGIAGDIAANDLDKGRGDSMKDEAYRIANDIGKQTATVIAAAIRNRGGA